MGEQQQLAGAASPSLPGPAPQQSICTGWASPCPRCRSPPAQAWGGGLCPARLQHGEPALEVPTPASVARRGAGFS